MRSLIGGAALTSAWVMVMVMVSALPGCIESSCEEKRTCGGSPAPNPTDAGSGGALTPVPRATGGRAGASSFGLGGSPSSTAGASSEGGSAGSEAEATATGGETAAGAAGDAGEPSMGEAGATGTAPTACEPNPCAHGTCSPLGASFECDCDAGYDGDLCDKNIDDCTPNPCRNGGRCEDGVGAYSCVCDGRFTGDDCELPRFEIIQPSFDVVSSDVTAVSHDGRVVIGSFEPAGQDNERAFTWKAGVFTLLDLPQGYTDCRADVMAPDDSTFYGYAWYQDDQGFTVTKPVRWNISGATVLPTPPDSDSTYVAASNSSGSVLVGHSFLGTSVSATLWLDGTPTTLELDSTEAHGSGVSADGGTVVGSFARDHNLIPFRWTANVLTPLPHLSGSESCWPSDISSTGELILGGCFDSVDREIGVLWVGGVPKLLEAPEQTLLQDPHFQMSALNSVGTTGTGVARDSVNGNELPVIWDEQHGMRWLVPLLEEQGVDLSPYVWFGPGRVKGISDDGKTVVGAVWDNDGGYHGFIARLP